VDQADSLRKKLDASRGGRLPLRVVAVTSGKGGVGKTHVAANLAVLAAEAGRRVLLVDADLGLANADIVLGVTPAAHIGHLLAGTATAEGVLTEGPRGVRILAASSGVQELTHLSSEEKLKLLAELDRLDDRFDLVIVDCGAGIGDNVSFFAAAAQEALLVVTPEPTSLSDAYATVKVLSREAGVERFSVLANQAADFQGRDVFRRLTQVTGRFLPVRLSYAGSVPYDDHVPRALRAQHPLVTLYPRAPAAAALRAICTAFLATPPPEALPGGVKLFWHRLLRERNCAA